MTWVKYNNYRYNLDNISGVFKRILEGKPPAIIIRLIFSGRPADESKYTEAIWEMPESECDLFLAYFDMLTDMKDMKTGMKEVKEKLLE